MAEPTTGNKWNQYRFLFEIAILLSSMGIAWGSIHTELLGVAKQHEQLLLDVKDIKEELHKRDLTDLQTLDELKLRIQQDEDFLLSPSERQYIIQRKK